MDFRVQILYPHLDKNYNRVATGSDTFPVRSELADGILTMKIHLIDGLWHTSCNEIGDTIVGKIDLGNKI